MCDLRKIVIIALFLFLPMSAHAQSETEDIYDLYDKGQITYEQLYKATKEGTADYWILMDMYSDGLIDYAQISDLLRSRRIDYDDLAAMVQEGYISVDTLDRFATDDVIDDKVMSRKLTEIFGTQVSGSGELLKRVPPGVLDSLSQETESSSTQESQGDGKAQGIESFLSDYWLQVLALLVGLIGVILAISGYSVAASKKKKSISNFMNEIDDTFESFKWKSKRCEAELYRLQDVMDEKLKEGKIDEATYHLLVNRIEKYLKEVQEVHDPLREQKRK